MMMTSYGCKAPALLFARRHTLLTWRTKTIPLQIIQSRTPSNYSCRYARLGIQGDIEAFRHFHWPEI